MSDRTNEGDLENRFYWARLDRPEKTAAVIRDREGRCCDIHVENTDTAERVVQALNRDTVLNASPKKA